MFCASNWLFDGFPSCAIDERIGLLKRGSSVAGFEAAAALGPARSVCVVRSAIVRVVTVVVAVAAALALVAPASAGQRELVRAASGAVGPSVSLSVGAASS